jgi:hypothetical protein
MIVVSVIRSNHDNFCSHAECNKHFEYKYHTVVKKINTSSQKELILDKKERQQKIKYVPVVLMNYLNISELSSEMKTPYIAEAISVHYKYSTCILVLFWNLYKV